GYRLLFLHAALFLFLAPPEFGLCNGLLVGILYMLVLWFIMGVYLSNLLHMGISHRALHFKDWFAQAVTLTHNTVGVYVDPNLWVRRHRKHHAHTDRTGDPLKLPGDGFWKVLWMAIVPYDAETVEPRDPILASWPFRLVSNTPFAIFSQISSFAILCLIVRDWKYALALWVSFR